MRIIAAFFVLVLLQACSTGKPATGNSGSGKVLTPAASAAERFLRGDSVLVNAHVGLAVYDPGEGKYIYQYQSNKYFVPASNTKILSCYAAMKTLGDRLPGLQYVDKDTALILIPTGDPTFLHVDYRQQPVADFLRSQSKRLYLDASAWEDEALGAGWSWGDYSAYYMVERSALPVYGNVIRWYQVKSRKENPSTPADTVDTFIYSDPELDAPVNFGKPDRSFRVERERDRNAFTIYEGPREKDETEVPFVTNGVQTALGLIRDTLHREIRLIEKEKPVVHMEVPRVVYSAPLDSMLKPMMHRSDNFFAEQSLLMAGRELTGRMNTQAAVRAVTEKYLQGIPQPLRWSDGSGLSRYNLFTPESLVFVLDKMKKEFAWGRITDIFATGGKGTLRSYVADSGRLYAKTGTLSGVLALSGYIITKKNRTLIFSIMVNNHLQTTTSIRDKMAAYLRELIENY